MKKKAAGAFRIVRDEYEGFYILVALAVETGRQLGCLRLNTSSDASVPGCGKLATVKWIGVTPKERGKGIATRLYEAAARLAHAKGRTLASDSVFLKAGRGFWQKQERLGRAQKHGKRWVLTVQCHGRRGALKNPALETVFSAAYALPGTGPVAQGLASLGMDPFTALLVAPAVTVPAYAGAVAYGAYRLARRKNPLERDRAYRITHRIYEAEGPTPELPIVLHDFQGANRAQADRYFKAHLRTDEFFRGAVERGRWNGIKLDHDRVEGWIGPDRFLTNPGKPTPGTCDPSARPLELAKLRGKRVRVHLNLHNGCYTVTHAGKVQGYASRLELRDVSTKVSKGGYRRCRDEHVRNVHAYLEGVLVSLEPGAPTGRAISYNCLTHPPCFYFRDTGDCLVNARSARCFEGGRVFVS